MPIPTPEWMAHLEDMRRAGRRADGEAHTPDQRDDSARSDSGVRHDLSDPLVLDSSSDYRLWVNEKRTVMMRLWNDGLAEVAVRETPMHTWGPPVRMTEEKT